MGGHQHGSGAKSPKTSSAASASQRTLVLATRGRPNADNAAGHRRGQGAPAPEHWMELGRFRSMAAVPWAVLDAAGVRTMRQHVRSDPPA
jgi:hypothetical protein